MRNALLIFAIFIFLGVGRLPAAGAEELRPPSKHPAPADQSASQDELKVLAELKAEVEAAPKPEERPKPEPASQVKKPAEPKPAEQKQPPKTAEPKAAQAPQPEPKKPLKKAEPAPGPTTPQAPAAGDDVITDEPIKITSNRLEADDKSMTVTFIGQVKAAQGATRMWCDKMVVHYTKEAPGPDQEAGMGNRKIRKIEVFGHVKVSRDDKIGTGQQGLYEFQEKRVILWGKARLTQGRNTINGDKVILYLDDNRAIVEGGPQKVEAVLVPSKKKPRKKSKKTGEQG